MPILRKLPLQSQNRGGTTGPAVLSGGCFWCVQDVIRKPQGNGFNPRRVVTCRMGFRNHGRAEAARIIFDPAPIGGCPVDALRHVNWDQREAPE